MMPGGKEKWLTYLKKGVISGYNSKKVVVSCVKRRYLRHPWQNFSLPSKQNVKENYVCANEKFWVDRPPPSPKMSVYIRCRWKNAQRSCKL